jgi:septum formation inhibitor MinC
MLEGGSGDNKDYNNDVNQEHAIGRQFEQVLLDPQTGLAMTGSSTSEIVSNSADAYSSGLLAGHDSKGSDMGVSKDSSGGIVVARGTGDGLILRLDGRVERHILLSTLLDYVESRKSFFSGQEVTLEWIEARPEEGVVAELSEALAARFQLLVKASRMFERSTKPATVKNNKNLNSSIQVDETSRRTSFAPESHNSTRTRPSPVSPKMGERAPQGIAPHSADSPVSGSATSFSTGSSYGGTSLFDGVAALNANNLGAGTPTVGSQERRSSASEALLWDEADARIIRDTLRGGQKIESEHSVVIQGDVNSGAEIVAGGDIFVLGRLRGVAHAGAYDESGGGRKIFALQMQPTQLRIGSVISQGSEEGGRMPEMAKIEGNMIVVEPYGAGSSTRRLLK